MSNAVHHHVLDICTQFMHKRFHDMGWEGESMQLGKTLFAMTGVDLYREHK
jgi:hypothetical protein